MKKKRILVCGASGFIGRNIFETLVKKDYLDVLGTYKTRNSFSPSSNVIHADLTDKNTVSEITKDVDVIIQAAATTSGSKEVFTKPHYHVTDNAVMNSLLFRAAHENHVPHVLFFSCTVMYPSSEKPLRETDLNLNEAFYEKYFGSAWTKMYIEKMCEFYSRLGRTRFTVIRHSNIYGPYDKFDPDRSHVFGATITKVAKAKDGDALVVWGNGEEERDLLYVDDLVRFVEMVLEKSDYSFNIFNVGLGHSISVRGLVEKIIQISEKKIGMTFDTSKPTIATKLTLDTSKANKYFGWLPKISLEEGIQKTMDWYKLTQV